MGSAVYLVGIGQDLLDAARAALATARTGTPPPARYYLAHGRPVVDLCDENNPTGQLSVYLDPVRALAFQAAANNPRIPTGCHAQPVARFVIEWWRCHAAFAGTGGPIPTAAELEDAAEVLMTDLWCMMTGILDEWRDGTLITTVPNCKSIAIGDPSTLGPQGGMGGWSIPVSVALSDSGPPDAS